MKSDAPKGDQQESQDNDMNPSMDEDDSEFDPNFDPLGKNKWAEPHGPAQLPGGMNGYAAHISRQQQLEAEIERQIEAEMAKEDLENGGRMGGYMNNARMKYGDIGVGPGMTSDGVPSGLSVQQLAATRYGEPMPGAMGINHNDVKLKENGELDLDNMTEEQLYLHMMRLQQILEAHGGNINDLGESSDYSESVRGMPNQQQMQGARQIEQNRGGVIIGSAKMDQQQKMKQELAGQQINGQIMKGQIQKTNLRHQQQENQDQVSEEPDTQRQLQQKKRQQNNILDGNFSIPLPKNPDDEFGCKFDPFAISLSAMLMIFMISLAILIFFVVKSVDQQRDFGVKTRNVQGTVHSFIHQDCRGQSVVTQPYTWQSYLLTPDGQETDISEVRFGPCNHAYVKMKDTNDAENWYIWTEDKSAWTKIDGLVDQVVQRVDPLGNLWYIDHAASPPTIGIYNITSGNVENANIQLDKMTADVDLKSLQQLNFRDGYVFALSNVGILVWQGDVKEGHFNKAVQNSTIVYFQAASPTQLQDFVTFTKHGSNILNSQLVEIDKNITENINQMALSDISAVNKPVFSNDFDMTFIQSNREIYQIMTNTKDNLEVIKYSLDNGPLKSPTVDINGNIYYLEDKKWKKKTFQFKQDTNYLQVQSIKLNQQVNDEDDEPSRRNVYYVAIVLLLFLIGGLIGFAYQKYKTKKDGPKKLDPKDQPCSQECGVADNYEHSFN